MPILSIFLENRKLFIEMMVKKAILNIDSGVIEQHLFVWFYVGVHWSCFDILLLEILWAFGVVQCWCVQVLFFPLFSCGFCGVL